MLKIRPYRDDDFTALGAIFLRAVQETASHDYSPTDSRLGADRRGPLATQNEGFSVLVAVIDPLPVGFISAVDRYIDLLFVAPEYGRRGIASALLQELFAQMPHGSLTVDASITAKPFCTAWFQGRGRTAGGGARRDVY